MNLSDWLTVECPYKLMMAVTLTPVGVPGGPGGGGRLALWVGAYRPTIKYVTFQVRKRITGAQARFSRSEQFSHKLETGRRIKKKIELNPIFQKKLQVFQNDDFSRK